MLPRMSPDGTDQEERPQPRATPGDYGTLLELRGATPGGDAG